MRGVTIRQLQIFSTAAAHLSFARTSEQLHLTQAAVSLQVKQLEGLVGLALFERRGRKVHLTEAGEHLARYARVVLDALRDADAAISALKGLRGGRIAVGAVSTAKYFAPAMIARFRQRYPDVRVVLSVNNREVIVRELERNEIDLAIMGTPPQRFETVAVPFADHPLVVIAPPSHPRAREHALVDGAILRGARIRAEDRQRDEQQRDDQAGGDGRHGRRVHLPPHDRARARDRPPVRARRAGTAADAPLVRRAARGTLRESRDGRVRPVRRRERPVAAGRAAPSGGGVR